MAARVPDHREVGSLGGVLRTVADALVVRGQRYLTQSRLLRVRNCEGEGSKVRQASRLTRD